MQNVSFYIRPQEEGSWWDVVTAIEKHGYKVEYEPVKSKVSVVISGQMVNPMVFSGKRILLTHADAWNIGWNIIFSDIVVEYYDKVYDIKGMDFDKIIEMIRGEIDTAESGSKD